MDKYTLKLWFFCAIYFTFITQFIGQVQQQQVVFPTQSVHSTDGVGWASNIGHNFITGSQFWVYINPNLEAIVARKSSDGTITTKLLMQNVQNNDNHAEFSLGVDNEGYIHVIGGQHNSSPKYYVSINPDDISSFEFRGNNLSLGGVQGTQITYQSFTRSNKGTLFLNYRNNVSEDFVTGARSIALARYDTKTKKWTMIGGKNYQVTNIECQTITGEQSGITAFVWNNSGVGNMSPTGGNCYSLAHYQGYQLKIKFDQNNGMHVTYNMADSINPATGQDVSKFMTHVFYAYSPDEGNTWFKANGNQITTFPITKNTGDLVHQRIPTGYVYPATTSSYTMPNSNSIILDKDGIPIIVQFDYIANSTLMFKWSGTSWENQTSLTNRSERFYTDLSKKIIYNFGSGSQFQMSYDNMATFVNNVTQINPATWYVVVDDYYLTKTGNVKYYARNDNLNNATIMNMVVSYPPDVLAPLAPAGLFSSEIAQNRITLNWTLSPELDVCRYDVFNNETLVGSTANGYYSISGLSPSTSYSLTVRAVDGYGNVSPISSALTVSTSGTDTQLPVFPSGLSANEVTDSSFKLNWNAATDNVIVVSYEIYKNGEFLASTGYTSYHVNALSAYTTYGMSVRAKDAAGNLSSPIVLNVKTYGSGLVIYEPYNYTVGTTANDPDGAINGGASLPATNPSGNPTGTHTGLRNLYGAESLVVQGLTYMNLATSGGAHNITNVNWGDSVFTYRNMTTDPFISNRVSANGNFGVDGQSLYFSFIAKTSSATPAAFRFNLGGSRNVFVQNTADRWSLSDNDAAAVASTGVFVVNTPTLLVVKIDFNAGAADVVSLYQNPPIDGTLGSPVAALTVGADFTISNFNTRPSVANAMTMDEFRMGLSYAAVTPSAVVNADTERPTVPTDLSSASVTATSATINWLASTDNVGVSSYDIFQNGILIGNSTTTSYSVTGLSSGITYSFTVLAKDAVGNLSDQSSVLSVTTLNAPPVLTKTWNGSWSPSAPNINDYAIINAAYTGNLSCYSLVLNADITLNNGQYVDVIGNITGTGKIKMSSEASLKQHINGASAPNIELTKKTRAAMRRFDYIYWGTPIAGDFFSQLAAAKASTASLANAFDLKYRYATGPGGGWQLLTAIETGKGFIARIKSQAPFTNPTNTDYITMKFTGVANNGNITVPITNNPSFPNGGTSHVLLANPYPSAIDANLFLQENPAIDGVVYVWTSATSNSGSQDYKQADYIAYTLAGAVVPSSGIATTFNGKIASGQGFKVKALGTGNVTFTNSMRLLDNNNQFYKQNTTNSQLSVDRFKLNMTGDNGVFSQILVVYMPEASYDYDRMYDAGRNSVSTAQLYSIFEQDGRKLAINARPNFVVTDVVPLGISKNNSNLETFTIELADLEGIFSGNSDISIYLHDKELNVFHNLNLAPYQFTTNTNLQNSRFNLIYQKNSISVFNGSKYISFIKNNVFTASDTELINTISIYDLTGRLIQTHQVHGREISKPFHHSKGVYIAQFTMKDGIVYSQKLINN